MVPTLSCFYFLPAFLFHSVYLLFLSGSQNLTHDLRYRNVLMPSTASSVANLATFIAIFSDFKKKKN